jgi:hypothetical protein
VRDRRHDEHPREANAEHDHGDDQRLPGHLDQLLVVDAVDEVDELEADEEEQQRVEQEVGRLPEGERAAGRLLRPARASESRSRHPP